MRKVSDYTVKRLSIYYRSLSEFARKGHKIVSSKDLAKTERLTPAQVRKDLSFFGSFGTRGLGYPVKDLKERIAKILGLNRRWNVALVGVGNVGSALVSYKEFHKQGFHIKLLFDNDQRKINKNHKGISVSDAGLLEKKLKEQGIEMVILAVPAQAAQQVADRVVSAGVKSILNFAPVQIKVPNDVVLRSVNMATELEHLSFCLVNKNLVIGS
jgi:redox-sensing transcriptional repressor